MNKLMSISRRKYQLEQAIKNHEASASAYHIVGEIQDYWAVYNSLKQDLADVTDELLSVTKRQCQGAD